MTTLHDGREQLLHSYTEELSKQPDWARRQIAQIEELTLGMHPYFVWINLPQEEHVWGSLEHHPLGLELAFGAWVSSGAAADFDERYTGGH